jgi:hypothetical protein
MSALVEAVTGRLRRATELALQVAPGRWSAPVEERESSPGVEAATLALAWVRTDESELQLARDLVRQAERQQASYDSKVLGAVLSLLRARLLWSDGDFELALAELRGAGEPLDLGSGSLTAPVTGWLAETLVVGEAASLIALDRPGEAIGLLRPLEGGDNIAAELVRNHALAAAGADQAPDRPSEQLDRPGAAGDPGRGIDPAGRAVPAGPGSCPRGGAARAGPADRVERAPAPSLPGGR